MMSSKGSTPSATDQKGSPGTHRQEMKVRPHGSGKCVIATCPCCGSFRVIETYDAKAPPVCKACEMYGHGVEWKGGA